MHADSLATEDDNTDLTAALSSLTAEDIPADETASSGDERPDELPDESPDEPRRGLFSRLRRKRADGAHQSPAVPMPRTGIATPVAAFYRRAGTFIQPFDPECGSALIAGADGCGKAWDQVCRRNPQIRRYVLAMLATTTHLDLVVAHLPILLAVAIHHVPAVRDMVTQTTEQMTNLFAEQMAEMRMEHTHDATAA